MAISQSNWREQSFTEAQQQLFNRVLLAALFIGLGIWIGTLLFANDVGYITNLYTLYTEFISIAVTVGLLNYLAERREQRRRTEDLQQRLIRDAGSKVQALAVKAIEELRAHGWLTGADGLLAGMGLGFVNLEGMDLWSANLSGTILWRANLAETNLINADLSATVFRSSRLTNAQLRGANLQGADLQEADLTGAILEGANLKNAQLVGAIFSESTILPDGTNWTQDIDLTRFTSPDHPAFWQPD